VLIVLEEEAGGSETHEMAMFQSYTSSDTSLQLPVYNGQDIGDVAQPDASVSQDVNDAASDTPQAGQGSIQAVDSDQSVNPSTCQSTSGSELEEQQEEKRFIGDFDESANALWTLYGKEAKSYDDARINILKDDMDGVLIFVCTCSICTYYGLGCADM
jgi:hypothetical protein